MVAKLITFLTVRLNPWIIESTHGLNQSIKQARRPEFHKYTTAFYLQINPTQVQINLCQIRIRLKQIQINLCQIRINICQILINFCQIKQSHIQINPF